MESLRVGRRHRLNVAILLLAAAISAQAAPDDLVGAGRKLYLEGVGLDGAPVSATVQGDVAASGTMLACVGCHKRSGLGTYEAGLRALPVTAPALFGSDTRMRASLARSRQPYTDETLARAITQGIASDGRLLDPLMPRYRLTAANLQALAAYLRVLGAEPDPGVSETELDLVTIVTANAPASEREAVSAVVQRYAETINGGTRQEQRRAAASRRHVYGEKHARSYRQWNLSVWTLEGTPAGWPEQLEKMYQARPPFAVLSGAAGPDWPVIHDFCESRKLPCILPVTRLPVETGATQYTIYYSAGVRLEARVTARSIADTYVDPEARILVVYIDDALGRAAVEAFAAALPEERRTYLRRRPMAPDSKPSSRDWKNIIRRERPELLVAWLAPDQLQTMTSIAAHAAALPSRIYTASGFSDWLSIRALPVFEERVHHVYPYSLAAPGVVAFPREEAWLNHQGLGHLDKIAAAGALFACHATGEAMAGMADNYSREYLIESLEHMLDGSRMLTMFPLTTLGTGQRFLAKGAHVVRLARDAGAFRYVSTDWIQP
ncbi:MAG: hypothetical protein WAW79_05490 [Steroidobacteraceae bacterium]